MTPDTLGPYRIDRELGSGGMGKVYAAVVEGRVPGLAAGTRVALKVVHPHLLETPGFFKRFLREAEIGRSVRHPNVVRTYDCDATGGAHFLAMEYVEGQTLRDLLEKLERVPEELCRHIGREVAQGLAAIHAAGAIHRDVKPENVLITPDHVVKVMDLGVARLAGEACRLSQTGAFVGSLQYAAPESFHGGGAEVDARADLHALGLVLYELACGGNPYTADDVPSTIQRVLKDRPRRLGDINPQLTPLFEEVVHCLLEKQRDKRFATADELAQVLSDGEGSVWWHRRASTIRSVTKRPLRRVRTPRETAVYGRDDEFAKLRALYDAAKSGAGRVVLIEGEAGIGKSRVVDELIGRLQRDGEDINFLFGSYPPGGAATAAGGFSTAFREQFGDEGSAEYLAATPVLVPAFDALLRGEPPPEGQQPLAKASLQTCFVNATRALAAERPTVVLIDDLHFAPEEGRALFTALALGVAEHGVLLVGTARPGLPDDWTSGVTRLDHATQLVLPRLGTRDLVDLLRDAFHSEQLAMDLAGQIGVKSDGNPFFVFEIIRGLREGQFITQQADGSWVGTKAIEDIRIPASVLDLVSARVADLDEEQRDLLDVASCAGYEFDPAVIGAACGLGRIPTLKRFGQIERKHRLVRSVGRHFVFDHHQVQEALYQGLNEQLREEYHGAVAEALETQSGAAEIDPESLDGALCVELCEQYLSARRGADALRYLQAAQAHLKKGDLHAHVAELTDRALAVPGLLSGAERVTALARLANGLGLLGRMARGEECAREAVRLAEDAGDDAALLLGLDALGAVLWRVSRYDEAEAELIRARDLAVVLRDLQAEATLTGMLGNVCYHVSRWAEARGHWQRQLALSKELGDRGGEAGATVNLGNVINAEGRHVEAEQQYRRGLELCRAIGHRQFEAIASGNLGNSILAQSRVDDAVPWFQRMLEISREIGFRVGELAALGHLGEVSLQQEELNTAREHFERQLALSRELGDRRRESMAEGNLGLVALSRGDLPSAMERCGRHLEMSRAVGWRSGQACALRQLSNVLNEMGDLRQAEAWLLDCIATVDDAGDRRSLTLAHLGLGTIRLRAGNLQGAAALLVEARDMAVQHGYADVAIVARCKLAVLPDGDVADALTAFAENRDDLAPDDMREVRFLLWSATGDCAHLEEAKRLLDEFVAKLDDDTREAVLTNLSINREILDACEEQGL